jgi:hydrogenase maturation protease
MDMNADRMSIKCIAIGNRIMGDDSIGIRVLEEILPKLKGENIEVIFGETDIDYALSKINDGDFLLIIDSTYFNMEPGTVTFSDINKFVENNKQIYSQHQGSLIDLLSIYRSNVSGYVIGIEVREISFSLELSSSLEVKFYIICKEIYKFIHNTVRRITQNA